MDKMLTVKIDSALYRDLKVISATHSIKMRDMIQYAIKSYISLYGNPNEISKSIGSIKKEDDKIHSIPVEYNIPHGIELD